jgi:membrane protease YdiL (CAAX protease family)
MVGGILSGPLHLGWIQSRDDSLRRPVLTPVATGVGAFGLFYAGALFSRSVPVLEHAISNVMEFAEQGTTPLVLLTTCANGIGEEVFFRGALYSALGDRSPVATCTAIYVLATAPTRNPALVLAAGVMGTLFGLQRRATGGIQASTLTHVTWSALMVRYLPPLFRKAGGCPGTQLAG